MQLNVRDFSVSNGARTFSEFSRAAREFAAPRESSAARACGEIRTGAPLVAGRKENATRRAPYV